MAGGRSSNTDTAARDESALCRRVLIVEDHPLVANATSELLAKKDTGLDIVVCHSADEALRAARASGWFRLFLDLDVPGAHGLSLVREFVALGHGPSSCVITALDSPSLATEVRALGLLGYIVKAIPIAQFSSALDGVLRGEPTFPETALRSAAPIRLTKRQQELLALLQAGLSSKQIGARLGISEGTVNNHIAGLLRVLRVSNRTHAVARATELGLLGVQGAFATAGR
jgi:two-component system response regulator DesR